ncbi:MAG TPA: GMC family oxidoreductase [Flavitalea sp.]|nr:GMC family oxidoreductase [Flavitalea sp.]
MHIDARILENNTLIEGDICIVGAGAAGITLALQFLNLPLKVILLEGGGFNYETAMQDLYKGKNAGLPYYSLESSRLHYFGGTTGHWAGYCSEYDEIDFKKRDWIPESGWPITKKDLDEYYHKAAEILELQTGLPDNNTLGTSLNFDNKVLRNKMWYFSPPVRFGKKYRETIVNAANIILYTYANVTEIIADENVAAVKELTVKNLAGKQHRVQAKTIILACCAIQNARLLLASNRQASKGIGNTHDLVGTRFMEHLEMNAADLYLPQPASLDLYRLQFFYTKARAELALTEQTQQESGILNGTAALDPVIISDDKKDEPASEPSSGAVDSSSDPSASLKGWENAEKYYETGKYLKEKFNKTKQYMLFTRMEQSPNPLSRITLDTTSDALGVPRVKLDWQLTTLEKRSYRKLVEIIGTACGMTGTGRVRLHEWLQDEYDHSWPENLAGGWHHMGTTRMHKSSKEGVVDENCKVHGMYNLYIAGSSCFPTAGSANPTYTIIAMTLRLAQHLKSQ